MASQVSEIQTIDVGEVYPTLLQLRGGTDQKLVRFRRLAECDVDGRTHDVCFVAQERTGDLLAAPSDGIEAAVLVDVDHASGATEFSRVTADVLIADTNHAIGTGGVAFAARPMAAAARSMSAFVAVVNVAVSSSTDRLGASQLWEPAGRRLALPQEAGEHEDLPIAFTGSRRPHMQARIPLTARPRRAGYERHMTS